MKVFVSSVKDGYEEYRRIVKLAIEALECEAVLMEGEPALPSSPQQACLDEVADSNVMVLLIGERYGAIQQSGKSATHEEFDHAKESDKKILVFVEKLEKGRKREARQEAFLREVGDWVGGHLCKSYAGTAELYKFGLSCRERHRANLLRISVFCYEKSQPPSGSGIALLTTAVPASSGNRTRCHLPNR